MKIFGNELFLGATLEGKSIVDGETIYGFSVIPINEDKAFLVIAFDNEDGPINEKSLVYYIEVDPESISIINNKAPLYKQGNSFDSSLAFVKSDDLGKKKYNDLDKEFVGLNTEGLEVRGVAYFKIDSLSSIIIEDFEIFECNEGKPLIAKYSICSTESIKLVEKSNIKLVKER